MEVILVTVLIFHMLCSFNITPVSPIKDTTGTYWIKTPVVHYINTGDTIDLSCDRNHRDRTMWFGQKTNRSPFIILSAEMNSERRDRPSIKFYWSYNPRFNITWNPRNNSSTLTIRNINESDEGFYFCTIGEGIFTTPGTGHILILEGGFLETTSVSSFTAAVTTASPYQDFKKPVLVALLCSALLVYSALAYCVFWMCCKRRQKDTSYTTVYFTSGVN